MALNDTLIKAAKPQQQSGNSPTRKAFICLNTRAAGIVTLMRFAGSEFIFENEWDEPYLLAKTVEGDDLLGVVCRHFT